MEKDRNIKEELDALSPFLAKMKDENLEVEPPSNYLSFLENSIMEQASLESPPLLQTTTGVKVALWQRLFAPQSVASLAVFALLACALVFFVKEEGQITDDALQIADLTDAEIFNYLSEFADDSDLYTLDAISEDVSIFDMIDLEEGEEDYLLDDWSIEDLEPEI